MKRRRASSLPFARDGGRATLAGRRLHLIGLGGAGMSGYARVATQLGAAVSGSDRADSPGLRALAALGVEVHVGHAAANVPAGEGVEVVHSTAIPIDNPERAAARERGAPRPPARRAAGAAERAQAHDRRRRRARQDHDDVDGRARAPALRPRALLPHRRGADDDRAQRRLGDRGVARGRGRRVGPLDALAARRRGGGDRTSSSTTTRRTARWPRSARPSARCWPARRRPSCGTAPTCSPCAATLPTWASTSPRPPSTKAARASSGAGTPCA